MHTHRLTQCQSRPACCAGNSGSPSGGAHFSVLFPRCCSRKCARMISSFLLLFSILFIVSPSPFFFLTIFLSVQLLWVTSASAVLEKIACFVFQSQIKVVLHYQQNFCKEVILFFLICGFLSLLQSVTLYRQYFACNEKGISQLKTYP